MFDEFADYYDRCFDRTSDTAFYCKLADERAVALLDLGCGTGAITIPMARRLIERSSGTVRIVGIDESHRMLQIARQREPEIKWVLGDIPL
jgi:ubiquinone/menaquinone biosynthesis C-methylase UbiE